MIRGEFDDLSVFGNLLLQFMYRQKYTFKRSELCPKLHTCVRVLQCSTPQCSALIAWRASIVPILTVSTVLRFNTYFLKSVLRMRIVHRTQCTYALKIIVFTEHLRPVQQYIFRACF